MHVFTHPYDLQVYFCLYAPIYMKYKGESGMCAGAQKMHMDISIGAYMHTKQTFHVYFSIYTHKKKMYIEMYVHTHIYKYTFLCKYAHIYIYRLLPQLN